MGILHILHSIGNLQNGNQDSICMDNYCIVHSKYILPYDMKNNKYMDSCNKLYNIYN